MAGFSQEANPITMGPMTAAYGLPSSLNVTVQVNLYNPSFMAATVVPKMTLPVTQRGQHFGVATLDGLRFLPGKNVIPLRFQLQQTSKNIDAIEAFILNYISDDAQVQPITVHGSSSAVSDPFLSTIFDNLTMTFDFKPPPPRFITAIGASAGLTGLKAKVQVFNPLPQQIIMGSLDMHVHENNNSGPEVFHLHSTAIAGSILQSNQSSLLKIGLSPFGANLGMLSNVALIKRLTAAAKNGKIKVGVWGPVDFTIAPSFQMTVNYRTNNITAILRCPVLCQR
mmetsp:Transcript_31306/g.68556  ORF Transcript_31306/g.68556 Transcript_31306/m.68556 type:complete len:282 (+) Transcript_31306:1-846(+)